MFSQILRKLTSILWPSPNDRLLARLDEAQRASVAAEEKRQKLARRLKRQKTDDELAIIKLQKRIVWHQQSARCAERALELLNDWSGKHQESLREDERDVLKELLAPPDNREENALTRIRAMEGGQ